MSKLDDQLKEWNDPFAGRCLKDAEDLIDSLLIRISNLEGWNKEMHDNHRIELARLHQKINSFH